MMRHIPRVTASHIAHSAHTPREAKPIKAPWPTRTVWVAVDVGPNTPIIHQPVTLRAMSWDVEAQP